MRRHDTGAEDDAGPLEVANGFEHFMVSSTSVTTVAAGCYHVQNVNSLHAPYDRFIRPSAGRPISLHPSIILARSLLPAGPGGRLAR